MIGMLRGIVWDIDSEKIILDVNGIGYLLTVPSGCFKDIRQGKEKVFYTHQLVREDDIALYGFNYRDEKDLFIMLLGVSGIGPKAALSILSTFSVKQVKSAILREDFSLLTEVPGIGGKTAKRLILELKEKIKDVNFESVVSEGASTVAVTNEALDTLLALGFTKNEARDALTKISNVEQLNIEDQIKEALRLLVTSKDKR